MSSHLTSVVITITLLVTPAATVLLVLVLLVSLSNRTGGHHRNAAPGRLSGVSAAALQIPGAPQVTRCAVSPADNMWNVPVIATIGAGAYVHADFGSGT